MTGSGFGVTPENTRSWMKILRRAKLYSTTLDRNCMSIMRRVGVTFAYLADPVIVGLALPIIPVPSVVRVDFCTVFIIIVVIWFPKGPVLKFELVHTYWKYTIIGSGLVIRLKKAYNENNEVYIQTIHHSIQNLHWSLD